MWDNAVCNIYKQYALLYGALLRVAIKVKETIKKAHNTIIFAWVTHHGGGSP